MNYPLLDSFQHVLESTVVSHMHHYWLTQSSQSTESSAYHSYVWYVLMFLTLAYT